MLVFDVLLVLLEPKNASDGNCGIAAAAGHAVSGRKSNIKRKTLLQFLCSSSLNGGRKTPKRIARRLISTSGAATKQR